MNEREAPATGNDGVFPVHEKDLFVGKHAKIGGKWAGRSQYNADYER